MKITKDLTIPKLFYEKAGKYGKGRVAMREKQFGIWQPITWHDYFENVKYLTLGLIRLGLEEGDKVAMIGDNRPEGLWAEMATLCARGVGVWLFRDCLIDEVKNIKLFLSQIRFPTLYQILRANDHGICNRGSPL